MSGECEECEMINHGRPGLNPEVQASLFKLAKEVAKTGKPF